MSVSTIVARAFFLLPAALIAFANNLHAAGLEEYNARLHSYFFELGALPIIASQGEEPGDVYETPGGPIYARRADCFADLPVDVSPTLLPKLVVSTKADLGGNLNLSIGPVADAAARHGIRFSEAAEISFGHPSGYPQIDQLRHLHLRNILEQRSEGHPCRSKLLKKLRNPPSGDVERGVPWIIEAVWYASPNISVAIQQGSDTEARARFKREAAGLTGTAGVEIKDSGNSLVLVKPGRAPFPVAWRPAFISSKHFDEMHQLKDTGWMRWLKTKIGIAPTDIDILNILRNQFDIDLYRNVPRPSDIGRKMSEGPAVDFDVRKVAHVEYLQTVNALFTVSWELYRKP